MRVDGHSEVVRLLLEAGADANAYDSLLVTPLHLAALGQLSAHLLSFSSSVANLQHADSDMT